MEPNEVEFMGEKELVEIVPNFNFDTIHLISGSIGPFKAGLPTKVPIWLAVSLKQQMKCRVIQQDWMEPNNLQEIVEQEKQSEYFTRMPSNHYIDTAQLLLGSAAEDIPNVDTIRTAIKDIWDIRTSKLRTSIDKFCKEDGSHAKVDNLTLMEINSVRPLLPHTLDAVHRLQMGDETAAAAATTVADSQSQDM